MSCTPKLLSIAILIESLFSHGFIITRLVLMTPSSLELRSACSYLHVIIITCEEGN